MQHISNISKDILDNHFDVIVVGGGHAGIEASSASARVGAKTLLITNSEDNLGKLSCNPAFGGIGKGIVVCEIDALDGVMPRAVDLASINRKMLNKSKGMAVWGPRHQVDRKLYQKATIALLKDYKNLTIQFFHVLDVFISENEKDGYKFSISCQKIINNQINETNEIVIFKCKSLIFTTGTFLEGLIIVGQERISAGRINEISSISLGKNLQKLNIQILRLKTGTPPRLDKNSINFENLSEEKSELDVKPFSYKTKNINNEQLPCFMTYTNQEGHAIIRDNFYQIPTTNGDIKFKGPRYCPSIEDKIRRFSDKERHQIFLEPEGINNDRIYPNGLSTSMSKELQHQFIQSIKGLEKAKIVEYGYAIEYNYIDPTELRHTLEVKKIKNLFLAGQIIGTTGYEEAGGLGLIAGTNAALKSLNLQKEFIIKRHEGYIGVMVDDLVTLGIGGEPYRLFTSRSEYRLDCRFDNADKRLTENGYKIGVVSKERYDFFKDRNDVKNELESELKNTIFTPNVLKKNYNLDVNQDGIKRSLFEYMEKDILSINIIYDIFNNEKINCIIDRIKNFDIQILQEIETEAKYKNYIDRQKERIKIIQKSENIKIPEDFNYKKIKTLSTEVIEKLEKVRPENILQASKIPGITPVSIDMILFELKNA